MALSETVGEGIISVANHGGSFHSLPGLLAYPARICMQAIELHFMGT